MKSTKLTLKQWKTLRDRLVLDHKSSIVMIRSKMRDRLGFTTREHSVYTENRGTEKMIYLDWFDEMKRTMFVLKYSEYFDASRN